MQEQVLPVSLSIARNCKTFPIGAVGSSLR